VLYAHQPLLVWRTSQYFTKRTGDKVVDWDSFIKSFDSLSPEPTTDTDSVKDEGPLRLDRQLRGKYRGSHSLRSLLETHHEALCSNPRDKVYGLAGLADDCYGFPVDYEKSLFEVWSDTLHFLSEKGQVQDDLPQIAMLMMNALGGPNEVSPPPGITSKIELWLDLNLVGMIAHVGPTPRRLIESLSEADEWTFSMRQRANNGSDIESNERLIRQLLDAETPELPCLRVFGLAGIGSRAVCRMQDTGDVGTLESACPEPNGEFPQCPRGESHLYQLFPPTWETIGCSLGIARGNLKASDIICRIPGTDRMLLLRWEGSRHLGPRNFGYPMVSIVGAVTISEDEYLPVGATGFLDSHGPTRSLCVEAEILYSLLSEQLGETEETSYCADTNED